MTDPVEPTTVRNPAIDRRARGESLERGTAGMDIAALLSRVGGKATGGPADEPAEASAPPRKANEHDSSPTHRVVGQLGEEQSAQPTGHGDSPQSALADGGENEPGVPLAVTAGVTSGSIETRGGAGEPAAARPDAARADRGGKGAATDLDSVVDAVTAVANLFSTESLDADTDFFDAGGSSIAAVEFVAALARDLNIHLDLDTVFFDARPRRLARRWLADHPEYVAPRTESSGCDHSAPKQATGVGVGGVSSAGQQSPAAVTAGFASTSPSANGPIGAAGTSPTRFGAAQPVAGAEANGPAPMRTVSPDPVADTDDLAQLFADLAGADRLPVVSAPERIAPRRILLTGATGFLGSHLLLDLLRHSDAHVICLVRADDEAAATRRLEQAVRGYALPWSREVLRRVTPLAGDLREPRLGLTVQRWESLAADVDSVVNAGAAVDFLRGYPSLRRTNVLGPLTLAELACTTRSKPLHHVSSLAVFNGSDATELGEQTPTANVATLPIGYDRSKWAAEAVLRRAAEHGVVVTVLRPGGIGSHPETGAHNPRDLNTGITAALLKFRTVPGFRYLNSAPVDWVSRVAAQVITTPAAWGHTYHLTGPPTTLDRIVAETTLGGMGIRVQHWEQWCADVVRAIEEGPVPELESLAQLLQSPVARRQLAAMVNTPPASAIRTDAFVAAHGLPKPSTAGPARARMLEAMAAMGSPGEHPYLRFNETLSGTIGPRGSAADLPCDLRLTLAVASSAQVFTARTLDVTGELTCAALHDEPLLVTGTATVRPHEGIPLRDELRHPIMHYQLTLRDRSGGTWWLTGYKFAAARRRLIRQLGTQVIEIGRPGEPGAYTGEVAVPTHTYLPDQIDGIEVDPRLPERQQRLAKLVWLSWFGGQLGKSLMEPVLRVGIDLLDLRRALRKDRR
ncbi:thioester reductase domain-containing protein [Nocardia mangyaensis]|uniref:thioester reductase domain-containing protein n=1 Tax=Nocardia mangyaensis TaxID=2213200 RepID=UPI002676DBE7|nr:thioester reductase domain-containing protein [Nocardia mangyaensis]MDO3647869.1 thioester reductase domain-containing protein [Nocardia mangyaensis]